MTEHKHGIDGKHYKAGCPDCQKLMRDYKRELHTRQPLARKKARWSAEDREAFVAEHGNRCNICGTDEPGGRPGWGWAIDHDHACCPTGKSCDKCRRGILCHPCNRALGLFQDSTILLRAAADYLERTVR